MLLLVASTAAGHATERAAEVLPGGVARISLSAPVESELLRAQVIASSGSVRPVRIARDPQDARAVRVTAGELAADDAVAYRAFSRDGHAAGGVLRAGRDGVLRPVPGAVPPVRGDGGPLAVVARLLAVGAPLALGGLILGRLLVVEPALASGGLRAPGRPRRAPGPAPALGSWAGAAWGLIACWGVGLALTPAVALRSLRAGPDELGDLIAGTRFGVAWLVQAAALLVTIPAIVALGRRAGPGAAAAAILPAAALVAISWSGHAVGGTDPTLGAGIDAVHQLASAAWIGGLVALVTVLFGALDDAPPADRTPLAAAAVVRFSALAVAAVAAITLTGVYRALAELSAPGDLIDTAYGRALTAKLAVFAALLCVGAYNRFVVHPRLERAALGLESTDRGAERALRVSVRAELALAAGLLVAVAALLSLPPPA